VSRELYVEPDNLREIAKLVKIQQEVLLYLFQEHKTEVDTKLQSQGQRSSGVIRSNNRMKLTPGSWKLHRRG
jgi:hypothetical protein